MSNAGGADSPQTPARAARRPQRDHVVPARAQTFGMWLFLITLTMLFASGMVGYVFIRLAGAGMPRPGAMRPALLNPLLFSSTALVLLASVAIHMAVARVRRERFRPFIRWLLITDALALGFLTVQAPAMVGLFSQDEGIGHALGQTGVRDTRLYGLIFVFVLLHALHVLGGMIYLAIVTRRAFAGRYDHEHHTGVRHAAMYWHFLDGVWLLMFGTFLAVG